MDPNTPPRDHGRAGDTTHGASDIVHGDWVEQAMPSALQPYFRLARIDRPIGTWLLLLPGWWAIALAAPGWPSPWLLGLFGIGAVVMRAAGCVVNDLADRKFDAMVARTASRPIASGAVSVPAALVFLAALLAVGLAILLQFNTFAILIGALSLALIFPYPLMKRITHWPQAFLGLTFNWGALLGWAAVTGRLDPPAIALYAAGFFWTLGYDTIYAHQDKQDDALIGVKSTALLFAANSRPWIALFLTITVLLLGLAGWLAQLAWPYYVGLALAAGHLAWQTAAVDFDDPRDCRKKFNSNRDFGLILLAGIIASQVV